MTAPKTPPQSPARNLVQASSSRSPENVPEPGTPRNMHQASKKKFSIRGLLNGESKKERRARQAAGEAAKAKGGSGKIDADVDTVYHVDVDDRTLSTTTTPGGDRAVEGFLAGGNKSYMLKVVLLLMDPDTRRFELLQLEFDSDKALVSDVLTQIPVAVTEDVLKKQTYVGICGAAGSEMNSAILLSVFCKGSDVLVAVPAGVDASECARLARPILNDIKVIDMLKASGIDSSAWQEGAKSAAPTTTTTTTKSREMPVEQAPKAAEGGSSMFTLVFFVLAAVILQVYHSKITAPIAPGQVLSPGGWVSRCGLATLLPICDNAFLQMGDDGVLSLFDAKGELEWKMDGGVCKKEDCISGLEMREDSHLAVGGKVVTWVNVKKDSESLSPWPFAEQPNLKVIHARN